MSIFAIILAAVLGIYGWRKSARRAKRFKEARSIVLNFAERKNSEERHDNRGPHD